MLNQIPTSELLIPLPDARYRRINPAMVEDLVTIIGIRMMEIERAIQRLSDKGQQNHPNGRDMHLQYYKWSKAYLIYFTDKLKCKIPDMTLAAVRPMIQATVSSIIGESMANPSTTIEVSSHFLSQLAQRWCDSENQAVSGFDPASGEVEHLSPPSGDSSGENGVPAHQPDQPGQAATPGDSPGASSSGEKRKASDGARIRPGRAKRSINKRPPKKPEL